MPAILQTKIGNLLVSLQHIFMVKRFFSYLLVGFLWIVSYLPFWMLYGIANVLYVILYDLVGYRKSVVRMNLRNSFPNKTPKELLAIEKKFYKHLADLFVEIIKYRTISEKEISKRCKVVNMQVLEEFSLSDRSAIVVQGHYCNWEWVTYLNTVLQQRILSVYKPLHNKEEDKFMKKTREHFGAIAVPMKNIMRVLAKRQKAGELSAVGLASDQVPNVNKSTYWMPFLNQDTPVYLGAEKLAKMFDLPVVFLYAQKVKRGYYEIEFIPITTTPKETKEFEITEKHVRLMEKMIQEAPEYWMWSHKRWKHKRSNA